MVHSSGHRDHHENAQSTLSFEEQMIKLLEHWIKHNDEHAASFRNWAEKAHKNGLEKIDPLLEDAAKMTVLISKKFEDALAMIKAEYKKD